MLELGDTSRKINLYDTFEGIPEPSEFDLDWFDNSPRHNWGSMKWNKTPLINVVNLVLAVF